MAQLVPMFSIGSRGKIGPAHRPSPGRGERNHGHVQQRDSIFPGLLRVNFGLAQTPAFGSLRSRRDLHVSMSKSADIENHACASQRNRRKGVFFRPSGAWDPCSDASPIASAMGYDLSPASRAVRLSGVATAASRHPPRKFRGWRRHPFFGVCDPEGTCSLRCPKTQTLKTMSAPAGERSLDRRTRAPCRLPAWGVIPFGCSPRPDRTLYPPRELAVLPGKDRILREFPAFASHAVSTDRKSQK
jgi:hypothetical protein